MQNHNFITKTQVLQYRIYEITFTLENSSVYICDLYGNAKFIKWKHNATFEKDFDFKQTKLKISKAYSSVICLTNDDKKFEFLFTEV